MAGCAGQNLVLEGAQISADRGRDTYVYAVLKYDQK